MNHKFDELAKGLAQSVTRRGALEKFGLGLAGIALASLGLQNRAEAGGKFCTTLADCRNNENCCNGTCTAKNDDNNCGYCGNVCSAGTNCQQYSVPTEEVHRRAHYYACR